MNITQRFSTPTSIVLDGHDDHPGHECAVAGYVGRSCAAAEKLEAILYALQNRGRQGSGISLSLDKDSGLTAAYWNHLKEILGGISQIQDASRTRRAALKFERVSLAAEILMLLTIAWLGLQGELLTRKGVGTVKEVFLYLYHSIVFRVLASAGIGQNRYATTVEKGSRTLREFQPLTLKIGKWVLAVVHNGNIWNAKALRRELRRNGAKFKSLSDSEVILHLIAMGMKEGLSFEKALEQGLSRVKGAYCYIFLWQDKLYLARDPYGFHPLCIGKVDGGFVVASEDDALPSVNAQFLREVRRGEVVMLDGNNIQVLQRKQAETSAECAFEPAYIKRPNSRSRRGGRRNLRVTTSNEDRFRLGRELGAEETTTSILQRKGVVISGIPYSGLEVAEGYARRLGLPHSEVVMRNPAYVGGKVFQLPTQEERDKATAEKLLLLEELVRGKIVVFVDDSLVRGTTALFLAREAIRLGASEVHFRFGLPKVIAACRYGLDIPSSEELLAANRTLKQVAECLLKDSELKAPCSVNMTSLKGLRKALKYEKGNGCCEACFTGEYPDDADKLIQILT